MTRYTQFYLRRRIRFCNILTKVWHNKLIFPKVKPISASDEKSLDSAIAMANEMASRSMGSDIEQPHHQVPESPSSPSKRKFMFKFPPPIGSHTKTPKHETKTFTDEAASIPDIQVGNNWNYFIRYVLLTAFMILISKIYLPRFIPSDAFMFIACSLAVVCIHSRHLSAPSLCWTLHRFVCPCGIRHPLNSILRALESYWPRPPPV